MTLEEAIDHCREEAEKLRKYSVKRLQVGLLHAANDCEECANEHEQLAEWLTELKQRRESKVNRWIPCSERLPEIFYYVIVAGSDGIGIARYNGALFVDDSGATYPISAITHWIPLPEPPEVK